MNNIYLNSDPLLYSTKAQQPEVPNLSDLYNQYYALQQQKENMQNMQACGVDIIGNLDKELKELDTDIINELNSNPIFTDLNKSLQSSIQEELINLVKSKLNTSPGIMDNIKKQMNIIKETKTKVKEKERKNINEINDYMTNYSNITFDEYKKLKSNQTEITEQK